MSDCGSYIYRDFERVAVFASFISHDSLCSLSYTATDVIRGEVLDSQVGWENPVLSYYEVIADFVHNHGRRPTEDEMLSLFPYYLGDGKWAHSDTNAHDDIMTTHTIRVLEVFQGEYEVGDIIEIRQRGGQVGNTIVDFIGFVPFDVDSDLIIFLRSWRHIGRPGVLLNPWQSVYFFPSAQGRAGTLSLDTEIESVVGSIHELSITLNDLLQLSSVDNFSTSRRGEWEPTYAPPTERQRRIVPRPHDSGGPSPGTTPHPYAPFSTPYGEIVVVPTTPPNAVMSVLPTTAPFETQAYVAPSPTPFRD